MLIGLAGWAGSGKDTVGKILIENHGYRRIGFADKVRELALKIDPILENNGSHYYLSAAVAAWEWEGAKKEPPVRAFLQSLGHGVREIIGEDAWIDAALCDVGYQEKVVITDVRYPNEMETIHDMGGDVWYIKRPGAQPANNHVSELSIRPDMCDLYIQNDYAGENWRTALAREVATALHESMKQRGYIN